MHLPFGQGAHYLGMVTDEGWVDAVHLDIVTNQLYMPYSN